MKPHMRPPGPLLGVGELPQNRLLQLSLGHHVARCVHVAADLGIADVLKDGPKTIEEIASRLGCHSKNLQRVMRVLCDYGVFFHGRESDTGQPPKFALTAVSEYMLKDHPLSLRDSVKFFGSEMLMKPFEDMRYSVDTGGTAFPHVFGEDWFSYLAQDMEKQQLYDRAMTGLAKNFHFAILLGYDFSRFKRIVDIGGGHGALLAAILETNKNSTGILFDQVHVVEHAEEITKKEMVAKRVEIIGGDFFIGVPEGGDAYVITATLHDWEDEPCLKILSNIHRAMPADGVLLIGEAVLPSDGTPHFASLVDLSMMLATEGKERTEEEWRQLLGKARFQISRIVNTQSSISIIEATKLQDVA